ncbi:copper resistance CopC/CopD family protein [Streptomyces nodosus]|uniref:copper resistance CopC/CopD family protein n=1 Tax=Streptomyces nodosus TaxID=40318 RepID=UPI001D116FFA|nr:copper resistance protein CopC [Streptomyces nodosus]
MPALLLVVVGVLFGGAAPASAHAALLGSDPAQGSVVDTAPTRVTLTFSEQVAFSGNSLRVLDPKGQRVDTGKPFNTTGTVYGVKVRTGLARGTYTVTYQVVSADSHPVAGAFTFSIGAPSATTVSPTEQAAGGGVVGGLYGFARYVSYTGFILLVGGAAFVLACWQRGAGVRAVQRLVVTGWVTLTAATLALLLLRGSYTGSGKVADIFDLSLIGQVLATKSGAALVSRLLLLAAGALFVAVLFGAYVRRDADGAETADAGGEAGVPDAGASGSPASPGTGDAAEPDSTSAADTANAADAADLAAEKRDLTFGLAIGGAVVAAGLAATWAMAEHASTGIQTGLAMPVDILHLLSVAVWLGGLAALLVALYRAPSIEAAAVRRFSRIAFGSVLTLAATGIYQSWRQLGSWSALTGTTYGQLLLSKVGLIAVVIGIAWGSRRWTARLADTPAEAANAHASTHGTQSTVTARTTTEGTGAGRAEDPETASGTASGTASEAGEGPDTPEDGEKPKVSGRGAGSGRGSDGPSDPSERAAQLARQRAAMATARARRIRDADPVRSGLRRSVLAEAAVALVVLAVTTALTTTEPGRTAEAARAATSSSARQSEPLSLKIPFDTGGQDGKGTAQLTLEPARVGSNAMHILVTRPDDKAFDVPEVKVAFTLSAKSIGPLSVDPERIATGHWAANGVQIPMAGDWKISVTVRTSDIDQVTVTKNAKIG